MKTQRYQTVDNKIVKKYTIKEILSENWHNFLEEMETQGKVVRETIINEVEKIIACQDIKKGFSLYQCPKCHRFKRVPFTCKSRFCNTCGSKYSKDRALKMTSTMIDCPHRHVVFTIPEELRKYFAFDRDLLNILFEAASDTIVYRFNSRSKSEKYIPGMISVLHTFGRDMKWNPHIHMILCEEAIGNSNKWRKFNHINYEGLRRSWQFCVLKLMSQRIKDANFKKLVDELYKNHKSGFYVNSPPVKNFSVGVVNYIVRYTGRPVIAQSRITDYDGDSVTFTYTPHGSDELVSETVPVFDFIKKLIIHIPEQHFKMIRYYGFYNDKSAKHEQYLKRAKKLEHFRFVNLLEIHKSWRKRIRFYFNYDPLLCIHCRSLMILVELFCDPRKIDFYFSYIGYSDTS
jgi:hypothetical protein